MNDLKLGYIGLESAKRAEWETFAKVAAFGVNERSTDANTLFLRLDDRHHRIAIHSGTKEQFQYAGWDTGSEEYLEELIARLKKAGVAVTEGSADLCKARRVDRVVTFKDINGFNTELFYNPVVHSEPLVTLSPMEGKFVTGDEGLGHVVYACSNFKETSDYYKSLLGFRTTDSVRGFMTIDFLRCNPRHHSLGLMKVDAPAFFQHLMVQVDTLDDVGRCMDRAEKLGVKVVCTLGRHNVERMFSFYLRTPSGFDIEYGWGAISVRDEQAWSSKVYDPGSLWGHKWLVRPDEQH